MKILLSAFSCAPGAGSEPGVGWAWATELARHHRVHVLTHRSNRQAIEGRLARSSDHQISFSYYGKEEPFYNHGFKALSVQFYYPYWQSQIARWAKTDIASFAPDLIHHVTFVRYWTPSSLSGLPFPFVFGPVGGGEDTPAGLSTTLHLRGRALESVRGLARGLAERSSALRRTVRNAAIALGTTKASVERLRSLGARNSEEFAGCGIHGHEIDGLEKMPIQKRDPKHRFIAAGRLIYWKGLHLSIRAMAFCESLDARLEIFGAGPELDRLRRLVYEMRLEGRVRFHGSVNRDRFLCELSSATALIHPSLHESGSFVCLEAMAARVPVICLNSGGPGVFVTPGTGFRVEPAAPEVVVKELARHMTTLALNPLLVSSMGEAGRRRVVEDFLWKKRAQRMCEIYSRVVNANGR